MRVLVTLLLVLLGWSAPSYAVFLDGSGHYGLLGDMRNDPLLGGDKYRAIRPSFSFLGEARHHDRLSLFLELRLFPDALTPLFGDTAQPPFCPRRYDEDGRLQQSGDCKGEHQDPSFPGYEQLMPRVTQAYVRYGFEYCLLEVGRRGRDWGLGMFLDSGRQPFARQQSLFDGITCHVNMQKNQALGFSVGYDLLAETGTHIYSPEHFPEGREDQPQADFGAGSDDDDMHQIFFTIEYDNRETADNSGFTRVTGGYFASVFGKHGDVSVKFFDLYMALFYGQFSFRNEFLFRLGRSADPSWRLLGGMVDGNREVSNSINAIAAAGSLTWTFYETGSAVDKADEHKHPQQRHTLLLDYVVAPGDADGYYRNLSEQEEDDAEARQTMSARERNTDVRALALHQNFKPALIFFNGVDPAYAEQRIAGVFDPYQLVNVYLVALGYRYENHVWGDVEVKLISGQLQHGTSSNDTADDYYKGKDVRPIGYYGRNLGYELDVKYSYALNQELELGLAAALAIPGKAWKTSAEKQKQSFLLQTSVAFKF